MSPTRIPDPERPRCPACLVRFVGSRRYLCVQCWPRVAKSVRQAMGSAYRAWEREPTTERWAEFLQARDAVIERAQRDPPT